MGKMRNRTRKMSEEASLLARVRDVGSLKVLANNMEKRKLTVHMSGIYQ